EAPLAGNREEDAQQVQVQVHNQNSCRREIYVLYSCCARPIPFHATTPAAAKGGMSASSHNPAPRAAGHRMPRKPRALMRPLGARLPGLILAGGVAGAGTMAAALPWARGLGLSALTLSIILGMLVGNTVL